MDQDAKAVKPNSIRSLFTRRRANEGIKVDLEDGNWIRIRGADSDVVQHALTASARARIDAKAKDKSAKRAEDDSVGYDDPAVVASMVIAWSFDEPCTPEIVQEALAEAPYLRIQIQNAAFERSRFLASAARPLSDGPSTTHALTESSPTAPQSNPSETA